MAISISSNIESLGAVNSLLANQKQTQSTLAKLSSGKRVNSAQDDAAALAVAVALVSQQTSLNQAADNAGGATDVIDTTDVALNDSTDILTRMRELTVEAGSGALDVSARAGIQNEIDTLKSELDRIAHATEFNGTPLLSARATQTYQVGANNVAANDRLDVTTPDATAATLGVNGVSVSSAASAAGSLDSIDSALQGASSARAALGTQATRAAFAEWLARSTSINLAAASSSLVDADVATESSNLSRDLILGNASASVLVQANQHPQAALRLLSPA
jgi:flagellin